MGTTAYEAKQEARRERLSKAAVSARSTAVSARARSSAITGGIPMGQPILVGHHSEKRHRNALRKSDAAMRKNVESTREAAELERRAAAVGTGGISSDDPDAVAKLTGELARARAEHEMARKANAAWRKHAGVPETLRAELVAIGYDAAGISRQVRAMGLRVGDAPFILSNLSASVRRIEKRIEALSGPAPKLDPIEGVTPDGIGFAIAARPDLNRVAITTSGRLSVDGYRALKSGGWRWSPRETAWLRHLNPQGVAAAARAADALRGAR